MEIQRRMQIYSWALKNPEKSIFKKSMNRQAIEAFKICKRLTEV